MSKKDKPKSRWNTDKSARTPTIYVLTGPTRRLEVVRREDCAEFNDQGTAVGMPLVKARDYDALQAAFQAATAERDALREALIMLYDKFEDGTDCYEDPEDYTGYLGKAIKLSTEEEEAVLALIPTERAALKAAQEPPHG